MTESHLSSIWNPSWAPTSLRSPSLVFKALHDLVSLTSLILPFHFSSPFYLPSCSFFFFNIMGIFLLQRLYIYFPLNVFYGFILTSFMFLLKCGLISILFPDKSKRRAWNKTGQSQAHYPIPLYCNWFKSGHVTNETRGCERGSIQGKVFSLIEPVRMPVTFNSGLNTAIWWCNAWRYHSHEIG